ncbi:sterol-4-alpha-carboxylate 3-dehydrogenase, decarboxylating-like [Paramacrobiotus metropolitanus]|uniref:sterol-4-alpha-carboxylate 3-dehydrogenase, decarboxylating-like n=1 Tax=Paramacrobiotus metropolitanus TaxID=2943436 RepID=UPI0024460CE1|nr:sterol-4-alpha-carboxylate 3-dehydrogenase, decarboxylating-like [Paramacrobiotus metropolitanus]XP_055343734.1 sterol-4-alpha-carboxylate 3-dehydrogenase, decarboxylating-like [Paramacrobiotus metropolitanus]XP_055343735.1 sterol-4-alpha-carboxylate 3-dehydrogenase, decarboxylating-like [Paramacrobiotus metropolitanus]XP_055343736.1 sterol-4-alpha-carboxylate 3-dehydrogenase, decarboxylating-like [Paramacrobiotus metropolitanus]XP_055343737.1 sterol-4-alpha-carboxylate 3-dehydrogenase, deca
MTRPRKDRGDEAALPADRQPTSSNRRTSSSHSDESCLVIGGCGFLGRHLVEELKERGWHVRVFDIVQSFEDDKVEFHVGDLCDKALLVHAMHGCSVVFHCASPSPASNNEELFRKVNVEGTISVIAACEAAQVSRLVLTSSASVVYEGKDILGDDEDTPYAVHPIDAYTATKIHQEQLILRANMYNYGRLLTIAVRPHGIFGPRDPNLVPVLINAAKAGKMKYIVGDGHNVVDFTYVKNVVHGLVLAAEKLRENPSLGGHAFHITNDEPILFWEFMSRILNGLGYESPKLCIPRWIVYFIATILSFFSRLISPFVSWQPTFTPMRVALISTHHTYSCEKAKTLLGYQPVYTLDQGIKLTLDHFSYLKKLL